MDHRVQSQQGGTVGNWTLTLWVNVCLTCNKNSQLASLPLDRNKGSVFLPARIIVIRRKLASAGQDGSSLELYTTASRNAWTLLLQRVDAKDGQTV